MRPIDSYGNQMSEKAWIDHHRLLAKMNIKYAHKLPKATGKETITTENKEATK